MKKLIVCLIVSCFCLSINIQAKNSLSDTSKKLNFFDQETRPKENAKLSDQELNALIDKIIDISLAEYEKEFSDSPEYTPVTKEEREIGKQQVLELVKASPNLLKQAKDENGEISPEKLVEVLKAQGEEESNLLMAKSAILAFETSLLFYELDNGFFPTTNQGLSALIEKPTSPPIPATWNGPYVYLPIIDPWGNPYRYICPGIHNADKFDISSYGSDEIENDNDFNNWSQKK